jgi:diguanylate cyclase (GGDEF)-like protein
MDLPISSPNESTLSSLLQTRQRARVLVGIGFPILLICGLLALNNREWPLLVLIATSTLMIASSYQALKRDPIETRHIWPALVSYTTVLLYLIAYSGTDHGRALWFFSLPVFALMLLPPRPGAAWSAIAIVMAAAIMLVGGPELGNTSAYSIGFVTRFTATSLLISVGIYCSEVALRRYQDETMTHRAATLAESTRLKAEIARRKTLEQDLRVQASTDALTHLANRRAFMERFAYELARSQRHGRSPTLLILDIDHFKKINDKHGHPTGDAVLALLAQLLQASLRSVDIIGRIGGEEFAIVLIETDAAMAASIIERLLERIRELAVPLADGLPLQFTASIGSTEILWGDTIDTAIQRADEALYTAKNGGRDRHCQR